MKQAYEDDIAANFVQEFDCSLMEARSLLPTGAVTNVKRTPPLPQPPWRRSPKLPKQEAKEHAALKKARKNRLSQRKSVMKPPKK